ncbi:MAG: hypothetical protein J0I91_11985 [Candidatus Accumulibacter sp.]|nr:hypothetical protein [Accumulibacter sp.]
MKSKIFFLLSAIPFISSCAATIDYYSYSYKPPGIDDPQATISIVGGKSTGDIFLRNVDENGCDMGATPILSRSTSTETIHAGEMVFFLHRFSRGNRICAVEFGFHPKAKGIYEIAGETTESVCTSKIYEVVNTERVAMPVKKILYKKAGLTACRKLSAG